MSSPETLLQHATWLRRLAAGIVGDRATADDLVQDAYVAALRRPPTGDERPWLSRVLRNAARFRWRSDTNRAKREHAVASLADDATPSSEELLARHELQQLLARLVGELDEPFRGTILLRYAEGLSPQQIARRLGIPGSTVRSRVHEGLERLRRALDVAHAGDRKAWLLALVPLALWSRGAEAATVASTQAANLGGSQSAIAGVVAVAAVAAIALIAIENGGASSTVETHLPTRAASSTRASDPAIAAAPTWFVQEGAKPRHLAGRVVRDGVPVPDALVRLVADGEDPVEVRSDAEGRFDLGVQGAREITLGAARTDALGAIQHIDLRDPEVVTDSIELPLQTCNAWIAGRVTDANGIAIASAHVLREDAIGTETDATGAYELCALPTAALGRQLDIVVRADGYGAIENGIAPAGRIHRDFALAPEATVTGTAVANAALWIEPERDDFAGTSERAPRQVAVADAEGRFRFDGLVGGRYRLGGAARGANAVPALFIVGAGGNAMLSVRFAPAATLRGRVMMRGTPVAGARLAVRSSARGALARDDGVVIRHDDPAKDLIAATSTVSQPDGTFVLDGIPVGSIVLRGSPVRVPTTPIALVAGENAVTLEAEPLGRIRGYVRRHGVPVPFARVDLAQLGVPRGTAGPAIAGGQGITADAAGHFVFEGLEPGKYGFYADDAKRGALSDGTTLELADGETRDFDIELAMGAAIAGVVVDAAGHPVEGANVRFIHTPEQGRCTSDAAGAFSCGSLAGGRTYVATVSPTNDATRPFLFVTPAAPIELGDDATVSGIRLVIDPRTIAISGTIVDDTGAPLPDARVKAIGLHADYYDWLSPRITVADANGRFTIDRLAPGDYEVVAETLDNLRDGHRVVAAGTTDLVLPVVRYACPASAPYDPPHKPSTPLIWDDRIELVGWDLPATAKVGETIEVTLVWRVRAPIARLWSAFAHFDGSTHRILGDHDLPCPTFAWKPGATIVDRFTSAKVTHAESYGLRVGFFGRPAFDGPWVNLAGPNDDIAGVLVGTVVAN